MRFAAILSAAVLALSSVALGQTVTAKYEIDNPQAGAIELNFFQFGYTNEADEFVPLIGERLVESKLVVNFRPGLLDDGQGGTVPFDVKALQVSMLVPTIADDPDTNNLFLISGADLVETAPGVFSASITTHEYDGEVRSGRFSLDITASDPNTGEPVPVAGEFFGGSGFFYTVAVPEPSAVAGIGCLAVGLLRRARRRA